MKDKLKQIIDTFGIEAQQRKLQEELFELQQAITIHELKQSVEYEIPLTEIIGTKEHIEEELADTMVILSQFMDYYKIDSEKVLDTAVNKVDRTIERIENGYYKKN